jgi:hypothetical protein
MKLPSNNSQHKPLPLWQWANLHNAPRERLRWQADNQGRLVAFERTVRHG